MNTPPIVSVIVPTRNSSVSLEKCLQSIKDQTYPAIELIVVDRSSSDGTKEISRKYTKHVYQKGPERCAQRNYGVSQSSGNYVALIDSDMYLSPTVIEEAMEAIKIEGTVGVVVPEVSIGVGFWAKCKALERSFYVGVDYMEAARFFTKKQFESVGGYDESMTSGEDWDLSQRIAKYGKLSTTEAIIRHDEGKISLFKTVKKKYYYATHFAKYVNKNVGDGQLKKQTSILRRYALFFSKPSVIFGSPILFVGMLFMKTSEFLFGGVGLIVGKVSPAQSP